MKYVHVALLFVSLILVSEANEANDCGYKCSYKIIGNKLRITGGGGESRTDEFCQEFAPWYSSKDSITEIEVDGLHTLSVCAFRDFSQVTTAIIDAVEIGDRVFDSCHSLSSLTLSNVEKLGAEVFQGCSNLKAITLPSTFKYLDDKAFFSCSLAEINAEGEGNTSKFSSKDGVLFDGVKTKLIRYPPGCARESYAIPDEVTELSEYAFKDCDQLKNITISKNVNRVGTMTFFGCSNLETFIVDRDNKHYKALDGALYSSFHTLIRVPPKSAGIQDYSIFGFTDDEIYVNDYAFEGCVLLETLHIPGKLFYISDKALDGCVGLKRFMLESNNGRFTANIALIDTTRGVVKYPAQHDGEEYAIPGEDVDFDTIGSKAFEGCSKLKKITIPRSIKTIKSEAFKGCTGLDTIDIPKEVSVIEPDAFEGCTGLSSINVEEGTASGCKNRDGILVCNGTLAKYPAKRKEKDYIVSGLQEVKEIAEHAFEGCTDLLSVVIPDTVRTIKKEAFIGCSKLSSVEFEGTINPADPQGGFGFVNCPNLDKVCVPSDYPCNDFCGLPVSVCHENPNSSASPTHSSSSSSSVTLPLSLMTLVAIFLAIFC